MSLMRYAAVISSLNLSILFIKNAISLVTINVTAITIRMLINVIVASSNVVGIYMLIILPQLPKSHVPIQYFQTLLWLLLTELWSNFHHTLCLYV